MPQMKEQDKTGENQLNEVELGHLPEKEFTIMIVKMLFSDTIQPSHPLLPSSFPAINISQHQSFPMSWHFA